MTTPLIPTTKQERDALLSKPHRVIFARLCADVDAAIARDETHRHRYETALRELLTACDYEICYFDMEPHHPFVRAVQKAKEALP